MRDIRLWTLAALALLLGCHPAPDDHTDPVTQDTGEPEVQDTGADTGVVDTGSDTGGPDEGDLDGDGYPAVDEQGAVVDCDDTDPTVFPGAPEVWYDGVDGDCRCGNDFDQDGDTWMPDGSSEAFEAFAEEWGCSRLTSGEGDCDDTEFDIHPEILELLGDEVDQDCDGQADTAPLVFGEYAWQGNIAVVAGGDGHDYLLTIATEAWFKGAMLPEGEDADLTLLIPTGPDFDEVPWNEVPWAGRAGKPRAGSVDMLTTPTGFITGTAWFYPQSAENRIAIHRLDWDGDSSTYDTSTRVFDGVKDLSGDFYLDLDLRLDDEGMAWLGVCAAGSVHWLSADTGAASFPTAGQWVTQGITGGDTCFLDLETQELVVHQEVGLQGFSLDATPAATSTDRSGLDLTHAGSHGDLTVLSLASGGLYLQEGEQDWPLLEHLVLEEADATFFDADGDGTDEVYVVAALGDGDPGYVLAWADPEGALTETQLDLEHEGKAQEVHSVSIHVDEERVFVAAASSEALGWMFMGHP